SHRACASRYFLNHAGCCLPLHPDCSETDESFIALSDFTPELRELHCRSRLGWSVKFATENMGPDGLCWDRAQCLFLFRLILYRNTTLLLNARRGSEQCYSTNS